MTYRIQEHPDVLLWLELRHASSECLGISDGVVQFRHLDVEVHHRALVAWPRGPDRLHVILR